MKIPHQFDWYRYYFHLWFLYDKINKKLAQKYLKEGRIPK